MTVVSESATVVDALVEALRGAGAYNANDVVAPVAVLWTDGGRQWESLVTRLRDLLPILTLGPYDPERRTGPAYWLRCAITPELPDLELPGEGPPIIYLPGVTRVQLRAVEECPPALQPLAELQYRGVFWTQRNGRDWTAAAFLQNDDGGLGVEVGADGPTRDALQRALGTLLDEPVDRLRREAPLRAPFLDSLLHPDEVRNLLQWLNDPAGYRTSCDDAGWAAFRGLCRSKYGFDPSHEGELTAGRLLGERQGAWDLVWRRFVEAPRSYPGIPDLLRRARPSASLPLFFQSGSWPQDNEAAEAALRGNLLALDGKQTEEARNAIAELEADHADRRGEIWAQLGEAPLAHALEHLVELSHETSSGIIGPTVQSIAEAYTDRGWRADAALIDAFAAVESGDDVAAIRAAASALYRPWLEAGVLAFQRAVAEGGTAAYDVRPLPPLEPGTCLLFSDGLRFDLARRLESSLTGDLTASLSWRLAALPTVTPTAKPAVTPVADQLGPGTGFDTVVTGRSTKLTADSLRKLLADGGMQILRGDEVGDPTGTGWTEVGAVDSYGHEHGWQVSHHLFGELRTVERRIRTLIAAGWQRVVVVTDHGWLLVPGGLPKATLPEYLTEVRKGRCARMKPADSTDCQTVPWYWDPQVSVAVAPGIYCYEAGNEYEHGGLSPQECVTPVLTVTREATAATSLVTIDSVRWKGLRCAITLSGAPADVMVDLRTKPADPASSITDSPKSPRADGTVSLLVPDDSREGEAAMVVVASSDGSIQAQAPTVIGA